MANEIVKPGAAEQPAGPISVPALITGQALPDYLRDNKEGTRLQGLEGSDFIIPRIKLLQGISPEVQQFEAAQIGQFWHNVLNFSVGPSFEFIVCSNRKRYLLVPPMGDDRGILARAEDAIHWNPPSGKWEIKLKNVKKPVVWEIKDPTVRGSRLAEFGTSNPDDPDSKPAATLFHEYLVYLPAFPGLSPVLMSLARSQVRPAKDLNTKIELSQQPVQAMRFKAGTFDDKGEEGPFKNYIFTAAGWATEEQFKTCIDLGKKYATYRAVDEADLAHEGEAAGGATNKSKDAGEKDAF